MSLLDALRQSLTALGEKRWFRIAVAVVLSAVIGVATIVTYSASARVERFMRAVPPVLRALDLKANDPIAKQLAEKGTLDIGGVKLGDQAFATRFQRMFSDSGKIDQVSEATVMLVRTELPPWLPVSFVDDSRLPLAIGLLAIAVVNFACFTGLAIPLLGVVVTSSVLGLAMLARGRSDLAASLASIPAFLLAFALLVRALMIVLDRATPVFAVASGVVREAMRLRIAVVFAAVAIIAIPLLPQWIDPTSPLRYQVQTFLARSLDAMYLVCAFLTVFFGCATVAFEIRDRQAWMTLTKPVSRLSWLAGKWLGLVVVNAAVLTICTLAMVVFLAQMRARPAIDGYDRAAVRDEVLVARAGGVPVYKYLPPEEIELAVTDSIRSDPNARADIEEGRRTELEVKKTLARAVAEEYLKAQRSVSPGQERAYEFKGLDAAREAKANLTLRYKFYAGESDPNAVYPVIFILGEGADAPWLDRQFVAAQSNVITVPASAISANGTLVIRIASVRFDPNAPPGGQQFYPSNSSIGFDPDGLELLYKVDDFGPNLLRAQIVNLLKLSFVAMLAVTLSSFLSFPVACLVVFTVFSAGSIAPYLATSIDEYRIRTDSGVLKAVESVIRGIASGTEFSVRAFGEARASGPLVEGRLVPWEVVIRTFALIGIAWSGVLLVLGFVVFRRKELAIYSGQGG